MSIETRRLLACRAADLERRESYKELNAAKVLWAAIWHLDHPDVMEHYFIFGTSTVDKLLLTPADFLTKMAVDLENSDESQAIWDAALVLHAASWHLNYPDVMEHYFLPGPSTVDTVF